jgi:Zinc knuckle./Retroviral aspartyl protease.
VAEFCPKNEAQLALAKLETPAYHQGRRSVDEYVDDFKELIDQAGYKEGLAIVVKFRRGLQREIQDQIAHLAIGRPGDDDPEAWFDAAIRSDENRIANSLFYGGARQPLPRSFATTPAPFNTGPPRHPAMPRVTPFWQGKATPAPPPRPAAQQNPAPMDIDATRRKAGAPVVCYRCGEAGHVRTNCPQRFDIRFMSRDEREECTLEWAVQADGKRQSPRQDGTTGGSYRNGRLGFSEEQRVKVTPSLSPSNRYSCLEVDEIYETSEDEPLLQAVPNSETPKDKKPRLRKWERQLPKSYKIAALNSSSLQLRVEVQTTDTQEVKSANALLDCGATGLFIDTGYVEKHRLNTRTLTRPIPVNNVDGTPNEAGPITEIVNLILRYQDHSERATFAVTKLGNQEMLLGLPWLKEHNPEVNWATGDVKMSRCPDKCGTCRQEVRMEQKIRKAEIRRLRTCREGPTPVPDLDWGEEVPDLMPDSDPEDEPECLDEGDRIFAANLIPDLEEIRAVSNVSQRLAEAVRNNSTTKSFRDSVPDYLHDFEDVFSKDSYDSLPARKQWDHAVELLPDAKLGNCKIYPLSVTEQGELDKFLEENLASGRIRPSKSPIAAPVFFVKKKDGSLRLVQDYRHSTPSQSKTGTHSR